MLGVTAIQGIVLKLKRTFISKKFLAFCLLGVINTLNDAIFSTIYHWLGLQDNVAAVLGYFTALTIAFFLHSRFVFKKRPKLDRYFKFFISYIPNFIIFFLVTFITLNTMGMSQFWGTILASLLGGPITFIMLKFYTFGKK